MELESVRSVAWEAPEHYHNQKGGDWFLALAILTIAVVIAALLFANFLFALLIGLAGGAVALVSSRPPRIIPFEVSVRGIRIADELYPFTTLRSYYLDEDDPRGPQLLVMSAARFMPLLVLPIPEEYIDHIEEILESRLPEEFLEEPLFHKFLEFLGF
jgi:hypothetical protein